ncbi:phosphatidylcholine and lysophosphatidylcholine phospholipase [Rhodosporidiobolus nylandii]
MTTPLVERVHALTAPTPSLADDLLTAWDLTSRLGVWTVGWAYSLFTHALSLLTLRLPTSLFHLVHYSASLTFHLTFLKLLGFFLLVSTVISYVWKVRYLNRYTELRDLPGGSRIKGDEGFDLHPDLATDQSPSGFHNYLDEFLSAIKVFGYLEKPVFHELARHLQTRRLVAGDTLDLARDKSFYIVVDGKVEVYAKTGAGAGGAEEESEEEDEGEEGKGWQLLNCVESGGTLSSLFTILSLFTEDVKMRYEEDVTPSAPSSSASADEADETEQVASPASATGDIPGLSLDLSALSSPPSRSTRPRLAPAAGAGAENDGEDADASSAAPSPPLLPSDSRSNAPTPAESTSGFFSPPLSSLPRPPLKARASSRRSARKRASASEGLGGAGREATVARAVEDTTLAVIPAEAFRRLTKKFPNAAAHIVQVILTRLQRVTFLTAHKYLGLTREVIRTEQAINDLACYPLPASFWESGGIQRLRARFVPETKLNGPDYDEDGGAEGDDYFGRVRRAPGGAGGAGGKKVRIAPGAGGAKVSGGGRGGAAHPAARRSNLPLETPYAGPRMGDVFWGSADDSGSSAGERRNQGVRLRYKPSSSLVAVGGGLSAPTARQRSLSGGAGTGPMMNPSLSSTSGAGKAGAASLTRKAGDLLTMSALPEDLSRAAAAGRGSSVVQTPRLERLNTSRSALSSVGAGGGEQEFDLRDAVMESIAKSLGLVQPHVTPSPSADASPVVRPSPHPLAGGRGGGSGLRGEAAFNSSFGSLSFLGLQGLHDDDSSSLSSSSLSRSAFGASPGGPGEGAAGVGGSFKSMDLENEVEILYFPKGSVLVKEGERNAGLYFVIEGFLDVSMPEAEGAAAVERPFSASAAKKGEEQKKGGSTTRPTPRKSGGSSFAATGAGAAKKGDASLSGSKPALPGFGSSSSSSTKRTSFRGGVGVTGGPPPSSASASAAPPPPPKAAKKNLHLFTVRPGGIAGYLSSLSGFPSYVDITAKTECYVGFLPAKALERIMDRKPIVLLTLAKRLIGLLSPLVLHIDSALDWMHVSAGQVIYRESDPADSFYIVLNGRLRSIIEKQDGGVAVQAEYGQGESVGELDCITASPRPSTLHAIRDTELARMPMTLFNAISVRHPLVTIQISRIIAARLRSQVARETKMGMPRELGAPRMDGGMGKNNFNLKTVAILPTNRHVPVSEFASKLHQALETIGAPTSYLNQATVMQVLGRHAFSRMGQLKLAGWLAETEQKYRIVLYVADTAVSAPWTQTCIRQADCILVVADGGAEPELGEHEKLLVGMKTTARKELVLLHAERNVPSGTTRPWLKNRPWIHAHHHVEMLGATPEVDRTGLDDPAAVVALRKIAARVELQISKYKKTIPRPMPQRDPALSDFARLARRLCGKSIGVVLGGGGARGISHIGALRALTDRNIPVDMIGGTSIGSFIGGLYAKEGDLVSTYGRAKRFSGRMSTLWRILTDLTYPVVAYTTGHEFNRGIYKSFYGVHIEDMWLPFFCNTTNITHSRMDVHTTGYAWRYVRASMSLAGLLPPLCDEGDMLVDGGYVDNLPVSVMLAQGAASVFAVDVGSVDDTDPRNYGESVSGWWLLLQRWNPFGKPPNIPSITEIQARLTYVSSVKTLEEAKQTPGVLYMRMPVTQFGTMEFKRFTEILEAGSEFATELLSEWAAKGELPTGMEGDVAAQKKQKRGQSIRRNSI